MKKKTTRTRYSLLLGNRVFLNTKGVKDPCDGCLDPIELGEYFYLYRHPFQGGKPVHAKCIKTTHPDAYKQIQAGATGTPKPEILAILHAPFVYRQPAAIFDEHGRFLEVIPSVEGRIAEREYANSVTDPQEWLRLKEFYDANP